MPTLNSSAFPSTLRGQSPAPYNKQDSMMERYGVDDRLMGTQYVSGIGNQQHQQMQNGNIIPNMLQSENYQYQQGQHQTHESYLDCSPISNIVSHHGPGSHLNSNMNSQLNSQLNSQQPSNLNSNPNSNMNSNLTSLQPSAFHVTPKLAKTGITKGNALGNHFYASIPNQILGGPSMGGGPVRQQPMQYSMGMGIQNFQEMNPMLQNYDYTVHEPVVVQPVIVNPPHTSSANNRNGNTNGDDNNSGRENSYSGRENSRNENQNSGNENNSHSADQDWNFGNNQQDTTLLVEETAANGQMNGHPKVRASRKPPLPTRNGRSISPNGVPEDLRESNGQGGGKNGSGNPMTNRKANPDSTRNRYRSPPGARKSPPRSNRGLSQPLGSVLENTNAEGQQQESGRDHRNSDRMSTITRSPPRASKKLRNILDAAENSVNTARGSNSASETRGTGRDGVARDTVQAREEHGTSDFASVFRKGARMSMSTMASRNQQYTQNQISNQRASSQAQRVMSNQVECHPAEGHFSPFDIHVSNQSSTGMTAQSSLNTSTLPVSPFDVVLGGSAVIRGQVAPNYSGTSPPLPPPPFQAIQANGMPCNYGNFQTTSKLLSNVQISNILSNNVLSGNMFALPTSIPTSVARQGSQDRGGVPALSIPTVAKPHLQTQAGKPEFRKLQLGSNLGGLQGTMNPITTSVPIKSVVQGLVDGGSAAATVPGMISGMMPGMAQTTIPAATNHQTNQLPTSTTTSATTTTNVNSIGNTNAIGNGQFLGNLKLPKSTSIAIPVVVTANAFAPIQTGLKPPTLSSPLTQYRSTSPVNLFGALNAGSIAAVAHAGAAKIRAGSIEREENIKKTSQHVGQVITAHGQAIAGQVIGQNNSLNSKQLPNGSPIAMPQISPHGQNMHVQNARGDSIQMQNRDSQSSAVDQQEPPNPATLFYHEAGMAGQTIMPRTSGINVPNSCVQGSPPETDLRNAKDLQGNPLMLSQNMETIERICLDNSRLDSSHPVGHQLQYELSELQSKDLGDVRQVIQGLQNEQAEQQQNSNFQNSHQGTLPSKGKDGKRTLTRTVSPPPNRMRANMRSVSPQNAGNLQNGEHGNSNPHGIRSRKPPVDTGIPRNLRQAKNSGTFNPSRRSPLRGRMTAQSTGNDANQERNQGSHYNSVQTIGIVNTSRPKSIAYEQTPVKFKHKSNPKAFLRRGGKKNAPDENTNGNGKSGAVPKAGGVRGPGSRSPSPPVTNRAKSTKRGGVPNSNHGTVVQNGMIQQSVNGMIQNGLNGMPIAHQNDQQSETSSIIGKKKSTNITVSIEQFREENQDFSAANEFEQSQTLLRYMVEHESKINLLQREVERIQLAPVLSEEQQVRLRKYQDQIACQIQEHKLNKCSLQQRLTNQQIPMDVNKEVAQLAEQELHNYEQGNPSILVPYSMQDHNGEGPAGSLMLPESLQQTLLNQRVNPYQQLHTTQQQALHYNQPSPIDEVDEEGLSQLNASNLNGSNLNNSNLNNSNALNDSVLSNSNLNLSISIPCHSIPQSAQILKENGSLSEFNSELTDSAKLLNYHMDTINSLIDEFHQPRLNHPKKFETPELDHILDAGLNEVTASEKKLVDEKPISAIDAGSTTRDLNCSTRGMEKIKSGIANRRSGAKKNSELRKSDASGRDSSNSATDDKKKKHSNRASATPDIDKFLVRIPAPILKEKRRSQKSNEGEEYVTLGGQVVQDPTLQCSTLSKSRKSQSESQEENRVPLRQNSDVIASPDFLSNPDHVMNSGDIIDNSIINSKEHMLSRDLVLNTSPADISKAHIDSIIKKAERIFEVEKKDETLQISQKSHVSGQNLITNQVSGMVATQVFPTQLPSQVSQISPQLQHPYLQALQGSAKLSSAKLSNSGLLGSVQGSAKLRRNSAGLDGRDSVPTKGMSRSQSGGNLKGSRRNSIGGSCGNSGNLLGNHGLSGSRRNSLTDLKSNLRNLNPNNPRSLGRADDSLSKTIAKSMITPPIGGVPAPISINSANKSSKKSKSFKDSNGVSSKKSSKDSNVTSLKKSKDSNDPLTSGGLSLTTSSSNLVSNVNLRGLGGGSKSTNGSIDPDLGQNVNVDSFLSALSIDPSTCNKETLTLIQDIAKKFKSDQALREALHSSTPSINTTGGNATGGNATGGNTTGGIKSSIIATGPTPSLSSVLTSGLTPALTPGMHFQDLSAPMSAGLASGLPTPGSVVGTAGQPIAKSQSVEHKIPSPLAQKFDTTLVRETSKEIYVRQDTGGEVWQNEAYETALKSEALKAQNKNVSAVYQEMSDVQLTSANESGQLDSNNVTDFSSAMSAEASSAESGNGNGAQNATEFSAPDVNAFTAENHFQNGNCSSVDRDGRSSAESGADPWSAGSGTTPGANAYEYGSDYSTDLYQTTLYAATMRSMPLPDGTRLSKSPDESPSHSQDPGTSPPASVPRGPRRGTVSRGSLGSANSAAADTLPPMSEATLPPNRRSNVPGLSGSNESHGGVAQSNDVVTPLEPVRLMSFGGTTTLPDIEQETPPLPPGTVLNPIIHGAVPMLDLSSAQNHHAAYVDGDVPQDDCLAQDNGDDAQGDDDDNDDPYLEPQLSSKIVNKKPIVATDVQPVMPSPLSMSQIGKELSEFNAELKIQNLQDARSNAKLEGKSKEQPPPSIPTQMTQGMYQERPQVGCQVMQATPSTTNAAVAQIAKGRAYAVQSHPTPPPSATTISSQLKFASNLIPVPSSAVAREEKETELVKRLASLRLDDSKQSSAQFQQALEEILRFIETAPRGDRGKDCKNLVDFLSKKICKEIRDRDSILEEDEEDESLQDEGENPTHSTQSNPTHSITAGTTLGTTSASSTIHLIQNEYARLIMHIFVHSVFQSLNRNIVIEAVIKILNATKRGCPFVDQQALLVMGNALKAGPLRSGLLGKAIRIACQEIRPCNEFCKFMCDLTRTAGMEMKIFLENYKALDQVAKAELTVDRVRAREALEKVLNGGKLITERSPQEEELFAKRKPGVTPAQDRPMSEIIRLVA